MKGPFLPFFQQLASFLAEFLSTHWTCVFLCRNATVAWCTWRLKEGIRVPGFGVTDNCELPWVLGIEPGSSPWSSQCSQPRNHPLLPVLFSLCLFCMKTFSYKYVLYVEQFPHTLLLSPLVPIKLMEVFILWCTTWYFEICYRMN